MLVSLYVENVALIKKLNIDINCGFTVLTGETGGGKSIIIDSLSLLCGSRGDKSIIRTGEDYAFVEGVFACEGTDMGEYGEYSDENSFITASRRITADGRSTCRLNGRSVSVSLLKNAVSRLLNIHGQQDTQSLSDESTHLSLLDSYAGNREQAEEYEKEYQTYIKLKNEVERLQKSGDDKLMRLDVIDFQINELEGAEIKVGEEEQLQAEKKVLVNYEKIFENVKTVLEALNGREGTLNKLCKAKDSLCKIESVLNGAEEFIKRLESCTYEIDDIASSLRFAVDIDCDSPDKRIDEIEERLVLLSRLQRKYRTDESGLVCRLEELKKEKNELDLNGDMLEDAKKSLEKQVNVLSEKSKALHLTRKRASEKLEKEIEKHLSELDMPSVAFVTEFESVPFSENGEDKVEFLISANKGEEPRPIARIASGGELSRIMLSVKSAFASIDGVKTVVFDEIDTGISGKTSEKLGLKLKKLTKEGVQILCVTHSSQIASLADTHLRVAKSVEGDRTYTKVKALDFDERIEEIARIIGGITVTEAVKNAAREALRRNMS